jgi:uncharacterized membrane protein HdeD (DUF308 family)
MDRVCADLANTAGRTNAFGLRTARTPRIAGSDFSNWGTKYLGEDRVMSAGFPYFMSGAAEDRLRGKWGWFLVLGILLILAGVCAITRPVIATLTVTQLVGFLLLFGAGVEIASGIWVGSWTGFFLHLLGGLLYLFLGTVILEKPVEFTAAATLIMAVFFVAIGLARVVFSIMHRFHGWGWMCVSGLITFALGILIWRQWPEAAFWVIGTFVGIDLIFIGWSWVMLGLALKSLPSGISAPRV